MVMIMIVDEMWIVLAITKRALHGGVMEIWQILNNREEYET